MKVNIYRLLPLFFTALISCGGGGGGDMSFLALLGLGGGDGGANGGPYTVGGMVTGLGGGETVDVTLNGAETVQVDANGSFTFTSQISNGGSYKVLVTADTVGGGGLNCMAGENSGSVSSSNVTNVSVVCSTNLQPLNVNITGLYPGNTVVFVNNADTTNTLSVSSNGASPNFAPTVPVGAKYAVTVNTQPSGGTAQTCTPSANTGVMDGDGQTVSVVCGPNYHTIGGSFTGLGGEGLQIRLNNTMEVLTRGVAGNGASNTFTFSGVVAAGASYAVVVTQNPSVLNQTCVVTNGSGTVSGNITNVTVTCTTNQYSVGGVITGMTSGNSVQLTNNGSGNQNIPVNGTNTPFSFQVTDGASYNIAVQTHAAGKTCGVTNATGTVAGANVTNVTVACAFNTYTVSGSVSGLCSGQSIQVRNNGANTQTVDNGGSFNFTFPAQNDLSSYSVSVVGGSTPSGVACGITNGSGSLSGSNVTNVAIACTGCMSCAGTEAITVDWTASRSHDVNTESGGGHKIYFQTTSGASTSSPGLLTVPNTTSTTQGVITGKTSGCSYFMKVQGYSAINPTGGALSSEVQVNVP